jgi:nitrite reductase (NADH) large subunit
VDQYLRTSDPYISAIGECVEFEGITFGLVEPIWHQCTTLADRLALQRMTPFCNPPVATKLKVSGVQLFSAGEFMTTSAHRELIYVDLKMNIYRKLLLRDGRIVGVVLFGDVRDGQEYFQLLQTQEAVADIAHLLLMGKAFYQRDAEAIAA